MFTVEIRLSVPTSAGIDGLIRSLDFTGLPTGSVVHEINVREEDA